MTKLNFSQVKINIPEKEENITIGDDLIIEINYPKRLSSLMIVKIKNLTSKWLTILIETSPVNKVIELGPKHASMTYDLFKENFVIKYKERKASHWLRQESK